MVPPALNIRGICLEMPSLKTRDPGTYQGLLVDWAPPDPCQYYIVVSRLKSRGENMVPAAFNMRGICLKLSPLKTIDPGIHRGYMVDWELPILALHYSTIVWESQGGVIWQNPAFNIMGIAWKCLP